MKKKIALQLAILLLMTGCATHRGENKAIPENPPQEASRTAPPVKVPATAKRKLVLALTGPQNVTEAGDWPEFKREWRETFADYAKQAGMAYVFSDAEPKPTGEDGTMLLVVVADYRIVSNAKRVLLGAMTGNAYIDARIQFTDLRDGASFGEQNYQVSSSAWGGVFSKVTPQQVESIAFNIFRDIFGTK